jgi:hypothetical protein
MHISFRRQSTGNLKDDDDEGSSKKSSNFTAAFGDMGRNITKKMFTSSSNEEGDGSSKDGSLFNLKRNKPTDETASKMAMVISLLEDFRLQCPQTHAGLVVAFTATTLSPLTDADVKFKWYRMDPSKDQFLQIDEGRRAWYPPTADDIGKKICAQCEDIFEQGYCRYAEV